MSPSAIVTTIMGAVACVIFYQLGRKVGWHQASSQCLDGFSSALRTASKGIMLEDEVSIRIDRHRAIQSLSGEYKEELKARGIWKEGMES